jgi:hypothetical protein
MTLGTKPWHWRQALQLASQLPEEEADARVILDCIEEILALTNRPPPAAPDGEGPQLVRFPGGTSSPSRRASSSGKASVLPK